MRRVRYLFHLNNLIKGIFLKMMTSAKQQPTQSILPVEETNDMSRRFHRCFRRIQNGLFSLSLLVLLVLYFLIHYFKPNHRYPAVVRLKKQFTSEVKRTQENLIQDWFRLQKARVDWQRVIEPCTGNIEWGSRKPGFENNMRTSAKHSYISSMDIRPSGKLSSLFWCQITQSPGRASC